MAAPPHPRDVFALAGQEVAEASFADALERERLHHAWLLTGPEGVGKATFAYRAARRLMGARPLGGGLGSDPNDPVCRQISARSHPDLMVLERIGEDGKVRKVIPVEEARRLPEFFSKAPASSPYRVAIIDAADDLNVNAANALLKTLEEPQGRGVLFLISHAPGKLLPTIRSRCRRLAMGAGSEDAAVAMLEDMGVAQGENALRLARMARGAPGMALQLAANGALAADDAAREILMGLPQADEAGLLALADTFRGSDGMQRFSAVIDRLADRIHAFTAREAAEGRGLGLDGWAAAWSTLTALPDRVEAVNLDRADAFFSAVRELRAAAKIRAF
ncbi:DNA polymerase III subunit delta' [Caulobacter sp. NIBR2454]|uniref:DNA polymerase III subunit delta' n=1 Tax=Caulobacter sp. NIBR2454 TaxID=3015996 RepID=UPI0022B66560|nr:DNA polymerase III subunit delta' [Caulobacter sp. NIBR2454]